MEKNARKRSPLAEVEREVLIEGQEWMRRRLEKRLQEIADQEGEISPPEPAPDQAQAPVHDGAEKLRGRD